MNSGVATRIKIALLSPPTLGWERITRGLQIKIGVSAKSLGGGVGSRVSLPERGRGWRESYISKPTLAPPPPVPAPASAPLSSQPSGARRTDTQREASLPLPSPRPPSPGSLPRSPFLKAASQARRTQSVAGLTSPAGAPRTQVAARCALARVTLTLLSPPTSRQLAY